MPAPASSPTINRLGLARRFVLTTALAAVIALAVWAIASHSKGQPVRHTTYKDTSVLQSLAPEQQRYVRGLSSLSYEQIAAGFGTER